MALGQGAGMLAPSLAFEVGPLTTERGALAWSRMGE